MRGRARRRDAGLVVRMLLVLALLAATCAAIAAGFVWLFAVRPSWWPYWSALGLALVVAAAVQYGRAERRLLDPVDARVVDAQAEPELHALVARIAGMFDLRPPRIAVSRSPIPNSFTVGLRKTRAVVVVSKGLRRRLEPEELEAVLAHELAHIANADAAVMTLAGVPRAVGFELYDVATSLYLWLFLWPIGALLYGWGLLLTQADADMRELLHAAAKDSGAEIEKQSDRYGFEWLIVRDPQLEDVVTSVHVVGSELQARGFGPQLLAAAFRFDGGAHPVYWIYGYKRGAFWPFVPTGKDQERDNAEELELKAKLEHELPIEPDLSRWLALFDAPV